MMHYVAQGVAGSIPMADVVATLEPRFRCRGRAESAGAIRDARLVKDSVLCLRRGTLVDPIQSQCQKQVTQSSQRVKLILQTRKKLPRMTGISAIRRPPQIPQTLPFPRMKARENPRAYMHVEVALGVSCANASGYAHHQAQFRNIYTTSTLCPDLVLDLDTNPDTDPGTDLDTDHEGVRGVTVAMVTVAPTIIEMTAIVHFHLASAGSIDQYQP
ncbi:hypothetical protein INS49_007382 [Diaporthe citri]|uniref:uncharacterized protein n=1 Tax=Diaporthe citri TaxID=83186 RepID=UPI001C8273EB|nr:uncharacterized protein INS49_007382 [Diaporthe citri]KAG6365771.1 hypothetical protein INS49_007382 [Diaporthe citri]